MSTRHLVLAAGGTGGHMFPAQALADEMLARGWAVSLTTDARGLRYAGGFNEAVERIEVRSATFAQGRLTERLATPVTVLRGAAATVSRFEKARPDAVAGFGGYPSIPALAAAWWLRIPRLIHEQNGVLGRVNRLAASRMDRLACGTWPLKNPPEGATLEHIGNPVRRAVIEAAATPYTPPGDGALHLAVFGGSQGASAFARLVPQAVSLLAEAVRARLHIVQQARSGEEESVAAAYRAAGVAGAEVAPFFADLPARLAKAQLVIARAGASSVAEIACIGRPSVLIPYPHALDDHQSANASAMEHAGAAILAPEAGLTADTLARHLRTVLLEPTRASEMAEAARSLARTDATARLADLIETLERDSTAS